MKHKHRCYNHKPVVFDLENYDIGDRFVADCGSLWEVREMENDWDNTIVLVEKCSLWGKRVGRKEP